MSQTLSALRQTCCMAKALHRPPKIQWSKRQEVSAKQFHSVSFFWWHLIVRRDELRASKAMQHRVKNTANIEIIWNAVTEEITGDGKVVTGARLRDVKTNEIREIEIQGFFVAIGHSPNTEIFKGQIDLDENGYIKTIPGSTRTNVAGVFAAGDVQDHVFRQAVTAAGTGCMAAIEAERWMGSRE